MTWAEIAERCEKAGGPDVELDRKVSCALATGILREALKLKEPDGRYVMSEVDPYTASVDAMLSLIAETLPGMEWTLFWQDGRAEAKLGDPLLYMQGEGATPALALLVAYCRARATTPPDQDRPGMTGNPKGDGYE